MNRHSKIAILVAPFLILGGYVLSDFYLEDQAQKKRVFELAPHGHCDVINKNCILKSGDFKINVYDEDGLTTINSTFPLDTATLFLVDADNNATPYPLGMLDSPYYWKNRTNLHQLVPNAGDSYKLRLIANIKGGQYISEFYTQTTK